MRYKGKLIQWNDDRGYGFIAAEGAREDHFVHISSLPDSNYRPSQGEWFTYELGKDAQGRPCATRLRRVVRDSNVGTPPKRMGSNGQMPKGSRQEPLSLVPISDQNESSARPRRNPKTPLAILASLTFFLLLGLAVFLNWTSPPVLGLYLFASGLAVLLYAIDKRAARRSDWRTPEKTLHLVSLAGGWPGALVAQQLFRHKSGKTSFLAVFWATVLLNCGALFWLHSPYASAIHQVLPGLAGRILPATGVTKGGIYQCKDARGAVLYSDRPCPPN